MGANGRVLVVEDDPAVSDLLVDYLSSHGYDVVPVAGGEAMRRALEQSVPDVVLLDVNLPGEDGLTLARFLRERYAVGIIMVTGAADVVDRVAGLEVGADDYVTKPFDLRELRARLKSVMRRGRANGAAGETVAAPPGGRSLSIGPCRLDVASRRLFGRDGGEIALTAMEFELLRAFAERPNQVLSRDTLLTLTRNREWEPFDRSIDIRIARLRRKIEPDPDRPQWLRTVRGAGYMYVPGGAS